MAINCAPRTNPVKRVFAQRAIYSARISADHKCMGRPKKQKDPIHERTMLYLWRTLGGFSQSDIAQGIKRPVSASTIARLEDGLHPYNQPLLEDIAEFLGITVLELVYINPLDVPGSIKNMLGRNPKLRDGFGQVAAETFAIYSANSEGVGKKAG